MEKESFERMVMRVISMGCAYVCVRLPSGDESIGTAFHVGEGVFLTARHVVENNEIIQVRPYGRAWLYEDELVEKTETLASIMGANSSLTPVWHMHHKEPRISRGPYYHSDPTVDVAAFVVEGIDVNMPALPLGLHYDDWIAERDWLLTKGIAMGFPPVPMSKEPILIASTVEVNGVVDTYRDRYVRFVVSGPPRGGFSGGPVYHEYGFVLGMITESLERPDVASEPGFFTLLSIESLFEVLDQHGLLPACQPSPPE